MKTSKNKKNNIVEAEIISVEEVSREAPESRIIQVKDIQQPAMNAAQLTIVTGKTPQWAIKARQGRGNQIFKYVPHGYVTDTLNKAFGFDWDLVIDPISGDKMYEIIYEPVIENGKEIRQDRHIAVAGHIVVRVKDKNGKLITTIQKSGFGSSMWLPKMEFGDALKSARSDLVKTCGFQIGIGLDLYYNERADIEQYVEKQNKKSASQKVADEFIQEEKEPTTGISLLTQSMSKYNLDGDALEKISGKSIDIIMSMNEKQITELWEKVKKKHASKKK